MNNITFNGKREIVYGLTKAASHANEAARLNAVSKGPRPVPCTEKLNAEVSAIKSYMDMATYDDEFIHIMAMDFVNNGNELAKDFAKLLRSPIKETKTPFDYFTEELRVAAKQRFKDILCINIFVNKIKSMLQ